MPRHIQQLLKAVLRLTKYVTKHQKLHQAHYQLFKHITKYKNLCEIPSYQFITTQKNVLRDKIMINPLDKYINCRKLKNGRCAKSINPLSQRELKKHKNMKLYKKAFNQFFFPESRNFRINRYMCLLLCAVKFLGFLLMEFSD